MVSRAGAVLAFPELSRERLDGLLPQLLSTARRRRAPEASCWSLLPTEPDELAAARPRRVWHIGASSGGGLIGHALVNVTTGRPGVAGIYNMGLPPANVGAASGVRSRQRHSSWADRRDARSSR